MILCPKGFHYCAEVLTLANAIQDRHQSKLYAEAWVKNNISNPIDQHDILPLPSVT
jgi:hypothetical protein